MTEIRTDIIENARNLLAKWRKGDALLSLDGNCSSNTMRKKGAMACTFSLGLNKLQNIISIDPLNRVAWVEPGVTMEKLVDATLPYGLIPLVVPEFKGITVGGAINGAALESSSHLHGQFNDTCLEYEVLLGDGSIVNASHKENPNLFYGMAGSYGTLGFLLSAKIKLQKTTGWMGVKYSRFKKLDDAIAFMKEAHLKKGAPEVLEAIVYKETKTMVMQGSQIPANQIRLWKKKLLGAYHSPWFYSHVDHIGASRLKFGEAIPIRDYLFRHDRGAFWMGGFALHPSLLFAFLSHRCSIGLNNTEMQKKTSVKHTVPKNPGKLFRFFWGWLAGSQNLFKILHGGSEEWFEKNFAIQDFYIPAKGVKTFVDYVLKTYKIAPLWLCPIASSKTPQLFSPHQQKESELLFDVGVYGIPFGTDTKTAVRDMERLTHELKGKKMFYCYNYMPIEEFWSIYPEKEYRELREKFALEGLIPDITEKVLSA